MGIYTKNYTQGSTIVQTSRGFGQIDPQIQLVKTKLTTYLYVFLSRKCLANPPICAPSQMSMDEVSKHIESS